MDGSASIQNTMNNTSFMKNEEESACIAAQLSYAVMCQPETESTDTVQLSTPATPLKVDSMATAKKRVEDQFIIPVPRLTNKEQNSPIGVTLNFLVGMLRSFQEQLELQRKHQQQLSLPHTTMKKREDVPVASILSSAPPIIPLSASTETAPSVSSGTTATTSTNTMAMTTNYEVPKVSSLFYPSIPNAVTSSGHVSDKYGKSREENHIHYTSTTDIHKEEKQKEENAIQLDTNHPDDDPLFLLRDGIEQPTLLQTKADEEKCHYGTYLLEKDMWDEAIQSGSSNSVDLASDSELSDFLRNDGWWME